MEVTVTYVDGGVELFDAPGTQPCLGAINRAISSQRRGSYYRQVVKVEIAKTDTNGKDGS